jgi:hypothetical protein
VHYRGIEIHLREQPSSWAAPEYTVRSNGMVFFAESSLGRAYAHSAVLAVQSMRELIDRKLGAEEGASA